MSRAKETQTNCALTFESVAEKEQQPPSAKLAAAFYSISIGLNQQARSTSIPELNGDRQCQNRLAEYPCHPARWAGRKSVERLDARSPDFA